MTVEIIETEIKEDKIVVLTCTNLEGCFLVENLWEDFEGEQIKFAFDLSKEGQYKYLYKIVAGQKKTQSAKSMGAKIQRLTGCITQISDAFKIAD